MKTTQNRISKKSTYIVGAPLPDKLPRKAIDFFAHAVTPQRAFDIAEQVERIAAKNSPAAKAKKRAC